MTGTVLGYRCPSKCTGNCSGTCLHLVYRKNLYRIKTKQQVLYLQEKQSAPRLALRSRSWWDWCRRSFFARVPHRIASPAPDSGERPAVRPHAGCAPTFSARTSGFVSPAQVKNTENNNGTVPVTNKKKQILYRWGYTRASLLGLWFWILYFF